MKTSDCHHFSSQAVRVLVVIPARITATSSVCATGFAKAVVVIPPLFVYNMLALLYTIRVHLALEVSCVSVLHVANRRSLLVRDMPPKHTRTLLYANAQVAHTRSHDQVIIQSLLLTLGEKSRVKQRERMPLTAFTVS